MVLIFIMYVFVNIFVDIRKMLLQMANLLIKISDQRQKSFIEHNQD